jgi:uncharacterized protein with von Willebrand factor type A (vWA) domain
MLFRYSEWDGTQTIPPLDPDELLDLLSRDLIEEGDLRRALERLLMNGTRRPGRPGGMRNLFERLRDLRSQQLNRNDFGSVLEDINERLEEIVDREREAVEQLGTQANSPSADPDMRNLAEQLAQRKLRTLDALPPDAAGKLQQLMDYEFLDHEAREEFQELVDELRQKMLGEQFRNLQQGMERLSSEDLGPIREMLKDLNQLLAKHARGAATENDFHEFMTRYGSMFPDGIDNIDDLVAYLERQAEMMASLLKSVPEEMRRQLMATMEALLQDEDLQRSLAETAALLEQITGHPLGRRYPFSGDNEVDLDEAMDVLRGLNDVDELERQLREAMSHLDFDNVDRERLRELLGREAEDALEEFRQLVKLLEEAGLAQRGENDISLTAKGLRRLGERTLRDLFAEMRQDRAGRHDAHSRGASAEQVSETKLWEFGDPFLVDIGTSISNAVRRAGPGVPVKIEPGDLEVHRHEALVTSATVIAVDMSRSMFSNGAFPEAKRVAFALNSLIKMRYPRDFLSLVVFSYFAMELAPERLLQSDWVDWSGTNIEVALQRGRQIPRPTWGPSGNEGTVEDLLREVKRCTQDGIRINTFMMDRDPTSMALAQAMMRINKGRVFFGYPGEVGRYVLVDYLQNKRKRV